MREAGRAEDATVNDVLLAATSVALGAALRRRGEAHDDLKALVPVSVREAPSELGNRLSFIVVSLPVAERDPAAALGADRRAHGAREERGARDARSPASPSRSRCCPGAAGPSPRARRCGWRPST